MSPPDGTTTAVDRDAIAASTARFFDAALVAFERAVAARGRVTERISIAGQRADLEFAGPALQARLFPALAHLRRRDDLATLSIFLFDSVSTGVRMPPPPWGHDNVRARADVEGLRDGRWRVSFNAGSGMLVVHDREHGRALAWTRDAEAVPYYETASPLRTLLAWWLSDAGLQIVHAAGVAMRGSGVLLTGRGGSGKTTTALLCVEAGWDYAGDNNLVLEPGNPLRAHALYASATVRAGTLERMPSLRDRLRNADRLDEEKGLLFVDDRSGARMVASFAVAAILLPRVEGGPTTRTEPADRAACMGALAPSSILPLPGAEHASFARLAAVARAVPAHHLVLGSDIEAIPGVVAGLAGVRP